jgi:hypothetical protein
VIDERNKEKAKEGEVNPERNKESSALSLKWHDNQRNFELIGPKALGAFEVIAMIRIACMKSGQEVYYLDAHRTAGGNYCITTQADRNPSRERTRSTERREPESPPQKVKTTPSHRKEHV